MKNTCVLVLDNIRSVENVGSLFRTAECLGVQKIILVGTTPTPLDRFGRKRKDVAKVALGAEELVPWEYVKTIEGSLETLKGEGYAVVALEQHERSEDLRDVKALRKFALILGNEVEGVSKAALEMSEKIIEIQMEGKKESLNVSVAGGIALFKLLSE